VSFVIGIDPGKKGGLCVLSSKDEVVHLEMMPIIDNEYDLNDLSEFFSFWKYKVSKVYIEKQWGYPKQSSTTTFEQGRGYGILLGMMGAWNIITEVVPAKTWQAGIYKNYNFTKEVQVKDKAFIVAQELYPEIGFLRGKSNIPKDGLIDALLIASYGLGRSGSIQASLQGIQ